MRTKLSLYQFFRAAGIHSPLLAGQVNTSFDTAALPHRTAPLQLSLDLSYLHADRVGVATHSLHEENNKHSSPYWCEYLWKTAIRVKKSSPRTTTTPRGLLKCQHPPLYRWGNSYTILPFVLYMEKQYIIALKKT